MPETPVNSRFLAGIGCQSRRPSEFERVIPVRLKRMFSSSMPPSLRWRGNL
jgi:hypothetical protein